MMFSPLRTVVPGLDGMESVVRGREGSRAGAISGAGPMVEPENDLSDASSRCTSLSHVTEPLAMSENVG
jgi:hypothetical protein